MLCCWFDMVAVNLLFVTKSSKIYGSKNKYYCMKFCAYVQTWGWVYVSFGSVANLWCWLVISLLSTVSKSKWSGLSFSSTLGLAIEGLDCHFNLIISSCLPIHSINVSLDSAQPRTLLSLSQLQGTTYICISMLYTELSFLVASQL